MENYLARLSQTDGTEIIFFEKNVFQHDKSFLCVNQDLIIYFYIVPLMQRHGYANVKIQNLAFNVYSVYL